MSSEWYFQSNGRRFGPISTSLLKQQVEAGRIGPETPVRRDEDGEWVPAGQVRGLFKDPRPVDPPAEPGGKSAGSETQPASVLPPPQPGTIPGNDANVGTAGVAAGDGNGASARLSRLTGGLGVVPLCLLMAAVALLAGNVLLELGQSVERRARWEYRIESPDDLLLGRELNELGNDGWELVFARRASSSLSDRFAYEMIFKRRRGGTGGE